MVAPGEKKPREPHQLLDAVVHVLLGVGVVALKVGHDSRRHPRAGHLAPTGVGRTGLTDARAHAATHAHRCEIAIEQPRETLVNLKSTLQQHCSYSIPRKKKKT